MENILILMVGLPKSGKSTWAQQTGYPIVNRNAIRLALHGKPYLQEAEPMITVIEEYMVNALFLAGHGTIIVDATHTTEKHRDRWAKLGYTVQLKHIRTSSKECISRAIADNKLDLIPIIRTMMEKINHTSQYPEWG